MGDILSDEYYMKLAYKEAQKAYAANEIPVGAIIVSNSLIIAKAHNSAEMLKDVTAHAEIIAITSASNYLQNKYLHDCTLYVTLEPCPMCAGALSWSQIGKIVYAAQDEKNGFMQYGTKMLHPKTKVALGPLQKECKELLKNFFLEKRKATKQ